MAKKSRNERESRTFPAVLAFIVLILLLSQNQYLQVSIGGLVSKALIHLDSVVDVPEVPAGQSYVVTNAPGPYGTIYTALPAIDIIQEYLNESAHSNSGLTADSAVQMSTITAGRDILIVPSLGPSETVSQLRS